MSTGTPSKNLPIDTQWAHRATYTRVLGDRARSSNLNFIEFFWRRACFQSKQHNLRIMNSMYSPRPWWRYFQVDNWKKRAVLKPSRNTESQQQSLRQNRGASQQKQLSAGHLLVPFPSSLVKGTGRQSSSLARKEWAIRADTTAGD